MKITHVFGSIPIADLDSARSWYERFIGRAPDLVPNESEAAWRLTETGWLYVILDEVRAGSALHTLLVDDLDAFLAGLAQRGITAGPVEIVGDGVRRTTVHDPDGNRLSVGQPPA
jgi:predicted enzyme related to lactoylglutathione lyase